MQFSVKRTCLSIVQPPRSGHTTLAPTERAVAASQQVGHQRRRNGGRRHLHLYRCNKQRLRWNQPVIKRNKWTIWGLPIGGESPKWMVYNGKHHCEGWFGGIPILGNLRTSIFEKSNVFLSRRFQYKESNDKNALSWRWAKHARSAMIMHIAFNSKCSSILQSQYLSKTATTKASLTKC